MVSRAAHGVLRSSDANENIALVLVFQLEPTLAWVEHATNRTQMQHVLFFCFAARRTLCACVLIILVF